MNVAFPIKSAEGKEFSQEDLMAVLSQEPHGQYLLGSNGQWHGGIHISNVAAPWCESEHPIRAIADGRVIAYRMNPEVLTSSIFGSALNYSNNFCLIEHHYLAENTAAGANQGKKNQLKFYSLYMHLAPQTPIQYYEIIEERSRYARADFVQNSAGQSCYEPNTAYVEIGAGCQFKKLGEQKEVKSTMSDHTETFEKIEIMAGGAKRTCPDSALANKEVDATEGQQVWIVWDQSAFRSASFTPGGMSWLPESSSELTVVSESQPIQVKAGDPIGFLGDYEIPVDMKGNKKSLKQAHIELFTEDEAGLKSLLNNEAGIIGSAASYYAPLGAKLCEISPTAMVKVTSDSLSGRADPKTSETGQLVKGGRRFALSKDDTFQCVPAQCKAVYFDESNQAMDAVEGKVLSGTHQGKVAWFCIDSDYVEFIPKYAEISPAELIEADIPLDNPKWLKDAQGKEWLEVKTGRFLAKEKITQISEYDLAKQGYKILEPSDDNYSDTEDLPDFFQKIFQEIETDNHELSAEEIKKAYEDSTIRSKLEKLIVKTSSEWHQSSDNPSSVMRYFKSFIESPFADERELAQHELERVEKLEWMSEAASKGLVIGPEVWHMWPGFFGEPVSKHPIVNGITLEFLLLNESVTLNESDYKDAANKLGCEIAAIKAVSVTESGITGSFFKYHEDIVPSILFEMHYFSKLTNNKFDASHPDISHPIPGYLRPGAYGKFSEQYKKLIKAYKLSPEAALKSASWGQYQIMGNNYRACGYGSVEEFVFDMSLSENKQLKAFVRFISSNRELKKSLIDKDWVKFASIYNGTGKKIEYGNQIKENYESFIGD